MRLGLITQKLDQQLRECWAKRLEANQEAEGKECSVIFSKIKCPNPEHGVGGRTLFTSWIILLEEFGVGGEAELGQ